MIPRVALNGFGRTGRSFVRALIERDLPIKLVAINDLANVNDLAALLVRDSVHGVFEGVHVIGDSLMIRGREIQVFHEPEPKTLPWLELGIDVAVEASGHFTTADGAQQHIIAGAARVIVSAPCKGADATFVMGVNDEAFDPDRHHILSNASCTTNCLAPLVAVLDREFGIENGLMTTTHAYTGDQRLVDGLHKDARRARAAALNIIPTTTGAARAMSLVMQAMENRLDGAALRVPVADGSITDLVALLREPVTAETVNEVFWRASHGMNGVLEYSEEPLVSSDVIGRTASCVFDSGLTMTSGRLVKVFGWYDNETGYAHRLAELTAKVGGVKSK